MNNVIRIDAKRRRERARYIRLQRARARRLIDDPRRRREVLREILAEGAAS